MNNTVYSQTQLRSVILPILNRYKAQNALLHVASGKSVDVYEIGEIEKDTPFYKSVMEEGVPLK